MALDPNEASASEIIKAAEGMSPEEKAEMAAVEREGKNRKTVLEALGDGEEGRRSGTGRLLQPQEADPRDAVDVNIGEQITQRNQELAKSEATPQEADDEPLLPGGSGGDATGASTPAGTGAAPAPARGGAAGGGTAGTGTTAGGV